jgi:hypothetical protein
VDPERLARLLVMNICIVRIYVATLSHIAHTHARTNMHKHIHTYIGKCAYILCTRCTYFCTYPSPLCPVCMSILHRYACRTPRSSGLCS